MSKSPIPCTSPAQDGKGSFPAIVYSVLCLALLPMLSHANEPRLVTSLNGTWSFRVEASDESLEQESWRPISVPGTMEQVAGIAFDGVGRYRRSVQVEPRVDRRILLEFEAAATEATVSIDGHVLGSHLGGWTPFRLDVTDQLRDGLTHQLDVVLDEKSGHNTQGFLPIIQPHYGGLWRGVRLIQVAPRYFDDLKALVVGDVSENAFQIQVPILGSDLNSSTKVQARVRRRDQQSWSMPVDLPIIKEVVSGSLPVDDIQLWSPESPALYEVELSLTEPDGSVRDRIVIQAGFRTIATDGDQLLLNGQPLVVRGLLNWGYDPPSLEPSPTKEEFLADLKMARDRGFNLIKFCLWVPPKEYLELADQRGLLTWVEYPTWHPRIDQAHRDELLGEYQEFYAHDRNHPSVILRSLTCETGPSADLDVLRDLYELGHEMIPGSVIEDDSSWIGWNRIHDFYDDHPYGNNSSWVSTLKRLSDYIADREAKPLILGEAIAADTWVDPDALKLFLHDPPPFWLPGFLDDNRRWLTVMAQEHGVEPTTHLVSDSLRYAMRMRKYQVETFRRQLPDSGYVVSVIRDFPLAAMGLRDYLGQPKWTPRDWDWHGSTMLLLGDVQARRGYLSGQRFRPRILMTRAGKSPVPARVHWKLVAVQQNRILRQGRELGSDIVFDFPEVDRPTSFRLEAELTDTNRGDHVTNHWTFWVVPRPKSWENDRVEIAARLTDELMQRLEHGGRVLLLPDGESGSVPLQDHWFLRGGPYVGDHPLVDRLNRHLLTDLQHFDLSSPVVPDLEVLDQIDPVLLLWDNHDIPRVKTHGLLYETRVGSGRLLVCALQPRRDVGQWLIGELVDYLGSDQRPRSPHRLNPATLAWMRSTLASRSLDLTGMSWRFRADPENQGVEQGWATVPLDDQPADWSPIRIDRAWEGQGHSSLDGWAWYRLHLTVPEDWGNQPGYLSVRGIDDAYEIYVDGLKIGSGGDILNRRTAFEDRTSHRISDQLEPGQRLTIAVRVYDWYGAGGIFRPVSLDSARIDINRPGSRFLRD